MGFFIDVAVSATEVGTLVIGIAGLLLSVLLLFNPRAVERLGRLMNYTLETDWIVPLLNRRISVDGMTFRYPFAAGAFLLAGSLFVLNFLFFNLHLPNQRSPGCQICIEALVLIGKISCGCGVILGSALIFFPEKVQRLETAVGTWVDTDEVVTKLNRFHSGFDSIFLRHPLLFGAIGLLSSFVLLILSLANLVIR